MGSSVKEGGDVVWCMAMVCGRVEEKGIWEHCGQQRRRPEHWAGHYEAGELRQQDAIAVTETVYGDQPDHGSHC